MSVKSFTTLRRGPTPRRRRRGDVRDDRSGHGPERHGDQVSPEPDPDEADLQQLVGLHLEKTVGRDAGEAPRLQKIADGF